MSDDDGPVDPAGATRSDGDGVLQALLRLQDIDTSIAQLQHRRATLAERRELDAVEGALATLTSRADELAERRDGLAARQAGLEQQIDSTAGRRKALEERMYAARGSAARDLQAMEGEVRHLSERRSELEEAELEIMIEQEPIDAELARLADERAGLEESVVSLREALAEAEEVVVGELSRLEADRVPATSVLPGDLLDRYEGLRRRLGGVGAARLVGNRCDGCHLELPSAEVDRIRHLPPDAVATCDQCGRILVRVTAAG